jgi:hypothetical protein
MADKSVEIDGSWLQIWGNKDAPFYIAEVHDIAPISIAEVQKIAPVAAHIKEVNHIDPINVESLFVSQVRNIDPIHIEEFNVTNLPLVNMAVRQLPPVEVNVGRLPALSIGTHQDFEIPSCYTIRARLLGLEVLRVQVAGSTRIAPRDRFRREQERASNRSYPVVATAGNPAIPSFFTSQIGREEAPGKGAAAGQSYSAPGSSPGPEPFVSVSGFRPAASGGISLSGGG